jgi:PAS domain S-box-containing protein
MESAPDTSEVVDSVVLHARSRSLEAQLELARDAIFARDATRRITFWNTGATETYGYTREEALGRRPQDLLRTEYPIELEEIEACVAQTGSWEGDLVQHTRHGSRLVVESRWAAEYEEDGTLAGLLEVNRDVTNRLAAQAAMLEFAPDAFVGVSEDGLIMFANHRAEEVFGHKRGELIGRPVEMLVPETRRDSHVGKRRRYFAEAEERSHNNVLHLRGRRCDGSEFPAEILLSRVDTEAGSIALAAIRDITDRVAAAQEREDLRVKAERERLRNQIQQTHRLESLGQLAGGIAHDFNNLLSVIINYAGFVASELEAASASEGEERWRTTCEDLAQIRLASERAAQLTHQLLAFARREVVQPEVVDVNAVVRDVEGLLRRTLGEHVELCSTPAEDLDAVLIDPGQLEQILVNVAVNARDAMPDGGLLQIDTSAIDVDEQYAQARPALTPGRYVRLRVSDNGTGMPPEVLERVFDPFFTTKSQGDGTGLGLATVYGIVQQAGGHVQIYSEDGVGTTFTALLPATSQAPRSRQEPTPPAVPVCGKTILVVEDEEALREVTRRLLVAEGYSVIVAADGPQALLAAAAQEGPIDLLLTDVTMPHMPGTQLAERLCRQRPGLKVLYMSGFAQPILEASEPSRAGMVLIDKPFSANELLAKVSELLAG